MKKIALTLLLFIQAASCNMLFGVEESSTWQKSLTDDNYLALDVRTVGEVTKNPAAGSINIPIGNLENQMSRLDKSKKVLVFCEVGGRASKAKKILKSKGFTNVVNIGSWRDWNKYKQSK